MKNFSLVKKLSTLLVTLTALGAIAQIPPDLVGEWAQQSAEFSHGRLSKGTAFYVETNGMFMMITCPPPLGTIGKADYNSTNKSLLVSAQQMGTLTFFYNANRSAFTNKEGYFKHEPFTHRQKRIPKWVLEEMK